MSNPQAAVTKSPCAQAQQCPAGDYTIESRGGTNAYPTGVGAAAVVQQTATWSGVEEMFSPEQDRGCGHRERSRVIMR